MSQTAGPAPSRSGGRRAASGSPGSPHRTHAWAPAFPSERTGALLRHLPSYARLAWRLGRDPRLSRTRRVAVLAAAAYLASPIDLVPGFIPLVGQVDDLFVAFAALRLALDGLPRAARLEHLAAVGLTERTMSDDAGTLGALGAWALGAGARAAITGARLGLRAAGVAARATAAMGVSAFEHGRRRVAARRRSVRQGAEPAPRP